jgi:hypothetical protein
MGDGYKLNWKLKENLRLNKTCQTCFYGCEETSFCTQNMYALNEHEPKLQSSINTCSEWIDHYEEYE